MRAEFDKDENLWNQFKRHVKSWYARELEYSTESDMFNRWVNHPALKGGARCLSTPS